MASEIRENVRLNVVESRLLNRDKIWKNKRKALEDVVDIGRLVTEEEINILASKMKFKSGILEEDLALLKIAFVQSADNIKRFLKVKGALHGLIRILSSLRTTHQLLAAECCCNLALGDPKSCLVVAKAAGPYLIMPLSGCNYNLIATSVWALGNLAGSDEKTWKIIHSQGFVGRLLQLITDHDEQSDIQSLRELQQNSLTSLAQLLRVGVKMLTVEEVQTIARTVANLKNSSCKGLKTSEYLLSCLDTAGQELQECKVHLKCLEYLRDTELIVETTLEVTACLRTISNLVAEPSGTCALEVLQNRTFLQDLVQKIFSSSYPHLENELGWLLGNLINHPSTYVQAELLKLSTDFKFYESNYS